MRKMELLQQHPRNQRAWIPKQVGGKKKNRRGGKGGEAGEDEICLMPTQLYRVLLKLVGALE